MKKLLFLLISLFAWGLTTYAQGSFKGMEIALHKDLVKDNSTDPEDGPQTRGIITQPAYAYLYNKVVTLTFVEVSTAASVRIIQESTGETVYSQDYISPSAVTIDLNSMGAGTYRIEIATDNSCLEGEFMF